MRNKVQRQAPGGRRRGVIVWLVAMSMVMVLGFCALGVDYGILASDRNLLQRGVDAAALAGATKLPDEAAATQTALSVGAENRVRNGSNDPATTVTVSFLNNDSQVQVTATRSRSLYFAKVVGFLNGPTSATAVATSGGILTPSVAPIGVSTDEVAKHVDSNGEPLVGVDGSGQPLNETTVTLIDHKSTYFGVGTFILFDLRSAYSNAKSGPQMQGELDGSVITRVQKLSAQTVIADVTTVDSLTGASQGSFYTAGMRTRFQYAAGPPWQDIDPLPSNPTDYLTYVGQHYPLVVAGIEPQATAGPFLSNPRIMNLIVSPPQAATGGNSNNLIVDFAPVYVEKVVNNSSGILMTVRFLSKKSLKSSSTTLIQ